MKKILAIILLLSLTASTCKRKSKVCKDGHSTFTLVNNSAKTINLEIYWNYPDTAIGEYNPNNDGTSGIAPNQIILRGIGPKGCWEEVLSDNKSEWVYIFDQDTIRKLDWIIVRQTNRGLLKRIRIDLDYLKSNNFTISYP